MDHQHLDESRPVGRLIIYLSQRAKLSEQFLITIFPMLGESKQKTDFECQKEEGVSKVAYWIDEGFGYCYEIVADENGTKSNVIIGIYPKGTIMLDEHGFFNGAASDLHYAVKRESVFIPFSTKDFEALATRAPEAAILAINVVAENKSFAQDRSQLLRMDKLERRDAMLAFFGREIEEAFTFKELAGYLDMTEQYYSKLKKESLMRKG
ncbi:cyclic nucleotide-binding domain-containing protein [Pedobacter frigoris]|uniref:Crp/Fnr family transcriptional regulator n=1 Tax=Pedobacter frigoris TaxID=2571272 RepID=A0A4U1CNE9_9SPHI|nr:hypothetical protein [Pedobacter frigoris]TKC06945.1 hypothetical protein FA047_06650 [Pedobacter frigoris]